MKGPTIIMVLAGVAIGAAGSAIVVSTVGNNNNPDDESDPSAKEKLNANKNYKVQADAKQKIIDDLQKKLDENKKDAAAPGGGNPQQREIDRLQRVINEKDKALTAAKKARVSVGLSPEQILAALPKEYESNERIPQRRRIYLTEALVDLDQDALPAIQAFLETNQDIEPNIQADADRRVADQWGLEDGQVEQIKTMMEDMKPQLEAEREKGREESEKRRAEQRGEWEKIRAEMEGLPEEERRQKMRERFQQMRERGERDRTERGSSEVAKEMESRVQLILSAEQYNTVKEKRGGVQAMLGAVTGRRGGFGDSGRDRRGGRR